MPATQKPAPKSNVQKIETLKNSIPMFAEQYACPCCDGAIPSHLVFSKFEFNNAAAVPAKRIVTIHCPHCVKFFAREFTLRSAQWMPVGDVAQVTNPRRLRGLTANVNRILGTQLAVAS